MNIQIQLIKNQEDLNVAQQTVELAFSTTQDANLNDWLSFEEMLKEINLGRGIGLLAFSEEVPVGMIYAQQESPVNGPEGEEKWVVIVASVIPEFTGKGIGKQLLEKLELDVLSRGGVKMFIFTNKDDEQVIHFYKKNGYEDAGWIKDYQYGQGNSAVFLLKYLK